MESMKLDPLTAAQRKGLDGRIEIADDVYNWMGLSETTENHTGAGGQRCHAAFNDTVSPVQMKHLLQHLLTPAMKMVLTMLSDEVGLLLASDFFKVDPLAHESPA